MKIKSYVSEEFNLFQLLSDVFPKRLEVEHVKAIIHDPLGFIGAILEDGITQYTRGEFELSSELDVFTGIEEDLLRCLGLIIIHFVNERSNNLIERTVGSSLSRIPSQLLFGLVKFTLRDFIPEEYKLNFRRVFLGLFQRIIPEEIYVKLEDVDSNRFTNYVLEGCESALIDLGFEGSKSLNIPGSDLLLRPFNYILKGINRLFEGFYSHYRELALDIFENDLRHLPTN